MNRFYQTIKATILVCCSILISLSSMGQLDLLMYNFEDVPQSRHINPSIAPTYKFYVGFPGLSSIHLHAKNNTFNPKHMFELKEGVTTFRTANFRDRLGDNNELSLDMSFEILSFGVNLKGHYLHFSAKERAMMEVYFPKDLLLFPTTGNGRFDELENNTLDFSGLKFNMNHFREYAIGWQNNITDKLSVGLRAKFLYGMENLRTNKSDLTWQTDPVTYDYTFQGQMDIQSSGLYLNMDSIDENSDLEKGDIAGYAFGKKNTGMAVDLGASYAMNDKLNFSMSLIDLGFINWKDDVRNYTTSEGDFVFAGLQLSSEIYGADSTLTDSIESVVDNLLDDVENEFDYSNNSSAYRTGLYSRIYLNGNYQLFDKAKMSGNLALTLHARFKNDHIDPSVTLAYNQSVGRWMSATAAYSIINKDYKNLGAGLRFNGGPFQWYIMADNLMPLQVTEISTDAEGDSPIYYPSFSENIQIHTGINFVFGTKQNDKDDDGVPDNKDKCPGTPGFKDLKGCPDRDKDGVIDGDDACPDLKGPVKLNGCPDSDGDMVIDKNDKCPDTPGEKKMEGCPDTDGDKVSDNNDKCPKVAGDKNHAGCPDSDMDGVYDDTDLCPKESGPVTNNGCPVEEKKPETPIKEEAIEATPVEEVVKETAAPQVVESTPTPVTPKPVSDDYDEDGVVDTKDQCPKVYGSPSNNGCPLVDSDSDGITDKVDKCPNTYGTVENNGCPELSKEDVEIIKTAFDHLEFIEAQSVIKKTSFQSLDNLAKILHDNPSWRLKISGHTDSIGTVQDNLKLSRERAQAVANFLLKKNVKINRMIILGFGESQPIESNMYEPGRKKNRRVELELVFD